jgi:serine-type D-Ala-D-Ala carboxypeptidase (penicillin-binding protein 5/6)
MLQNLLSLLLAGTLSLSGLGSADLAADTFDDASLLSVAPIPQHNTEYLAPGTMSTTAVMALDLESQTVLYEENASARLPIASLTKLMTAYIVLEENDTDSVVIVSQNAADTVGSSMGIYAGEQITVKDLLYGLLIESGNDAAVALAEHNAGSVQTFVEKMNQKTQELGMYNTNYANTTGLDSSVAYSSARDLALLSSHLVRNPSIKEIVRYQSADVTSLSGTSHHLESTNILLGQYGVKGLKTGRTPAAGQCFISYAESPSGNEVITVVLGSGNRFGDTSTLLDWIYRAYTW